MTLLPRSTIASIALIAALILVLAVLAVLQFRWSGQISEADRERMRAALAGSTNQFRQQFNNELQQLSLQLQPGAAVLMRGDWKTYAEICIAALGDGPGMHYVRDVYVWIDAGDGQSKLLHLNRNSKNFEPIEWPSNLAAVRESHVAAFLRAPRPAYRFRPFGRTLVYRVPVLLEALRPFRPPDAAGNEPEFIGFLMIELNRENLRSELLPALARSAFRDPEAYHVAVLSELSGSVLYRSDPALDFAAMARPDARVSLIEDARDSLAPGAPGRGMAPPGPRAGRPPQMPFDSAPPRPYPGGRGVAPIFAEADGEEWVLVAKHREGSLEAAVAKVRRRNLAISFGSLLLLAASMAFIVAAARRAQRLARLQMEFVAGVSHELRTPLAVICSAGDNLADGVVADSSRSVQKYGELIRSEGRKLAAMIERILQFAGLQRGGVRYSLGPVQINEVAEDSLKDCEALIAGAGFSVERDFAADLPPVYADPAALSQAVRNLVQNAVKYSGESHWLAVRTKEAVFSGRPEVQLIVEDRGIGIDSEDLAHIFEPFYRGKQALAEQIHGAGLGLYMVRKTLAGMEAAISVKSSPGKGSVFTMHFVARPT